MQAKYLFLTRGVGYHKEKLYSFELALRDAGIASLNLVTVSSILPPHCTIVKKERGLSMLKPGEITFCVLARNETNEPRRVIASSIGIARPTDYSAYGYLSEHHSYGQTQKEAGDYAEDLAATMLATTLGIDFDPDKAWDEKREIYRMSGKIVESRNTTQTATGKKDLWATTIAVAVFCALE